ncbi:hypothetical protein PVAP13_5NG084862 [Panicum virgatum]|uniref:Uncharacterized protein n=1 Tax=Panicum virgatum TaxID=38727 RepID=A0A8T0RKT8_PANVG|nr:hypothetical protein PVAP13_5NG084862 [Panicum virgatum]
MVRESLIGTSARADQTGSHAPLGPWSRGGANQLSKRAAGAPVLAAPEVVHREVELGGGEEEVHGLRGAEQRHHSAHRLQPQRVRHLQHALHPVRLRLHLPLHRLRVHPAAAARELHHRRRRQRLLHLVGGLDLPDAEVPEVALEAAAVEEVGELVLELHPGLGVQQVERGGGAPAAAPEVQVLGGGGPGRGEHAEHVVRRRGGLGAVVVLVVGQHAADEAAEVGLRGGRVRGRRGAELGEVAGLLGDPGLEELGEGLGGRRRRGAAIVAAVSGWRPWRSVWTAVVVGVMAR